MTDRKNDETTGNLGEIRDELGNFTCTDVFWPDSLVNGLSF